jgi:hypothetical protein
MRSPRVPSMKSPREPKILAREIKRKLGADTVNIVEIGNLLREAKRHPRMRHGRWLEWLAENFSMSADTAERYRAAAVYVERRRLQNRTVRNLSARVLYALAQGRHRWSDEVVAEILKEATTKRVGLDRVKAIVDEQQRAYADSEEGRAAAAEAQRLAVRLAEEQAEYQRQVKQAEAERQRKLDEILDTPPELPPSPAPKPSDLVLFDQAIKNLKTIFTRPLSEFTGTTCSADDLTRIGEFLIQVANAIRRAAA